MKMGPGFEDGRLKRAARSLASKGLANQQSRGEPHGEIILEEQDG